MPYLCFLVSGLFIWWTMLLISVNSLWNYRGSMGHTGGLEADRKPWFFLWSCMDVKLGLWRKLSAEELMLLNCGVGEDSWESLGLQGDLTSPFWRRSVLGVHWKDWCWSWNSSTLATSCEELIHWKRLWRWERLGAGGEGDDRGWDGWMASLTRWTWVSMNSGSWWWTGRPGVLRFMGSQRVGHDWATELNWTNLMDTNFSKLWLILEKIDREA